MIFFGYQNLNYPHLYRKIFKGASFVLKWLSGEILNMCQGFLRPVFSLAILEESCDYVQNLIEI
jgi:hypothetical protein